MNNVLILGGFTEGRRTLEPIANEAVELGFGHDADILTLRDAVHMDSERLRSQMAGKSVITHSAGLMAMPDARQRTNISEIPRDLIIVAGPEPRSVVRLARAAMRKTHEHLFGPTTGSRKSHLRVVAGNTAELLAHPIANVSFIPDIGRFSTASQLCTGRADARDRLSSFVMEDDAFYSRTQRDWGWEGSVWVPGLIQNGMVIEELPGGHDELLVSPASVLRGIKEVFDTAGQGQEALT